MKTAGRIAGTAAFLEGYYAQDFPVYGAERRGAPITAYTRISKDRILERGIFSEPDIVIIADESLINDPAANPLQGVTKKTITIINTMVNDIKDKFSILGIVNTIDATGLCLEIIGKGSAVSAALGGAACRIIGIIQKDNLINAVIKELKNINLPEELIEKNVEVAEKCYEILSPIIIQHGEDIPDSPIETITLPYQYPTMSSPSVFSSGNIIEKKTGGWRIFKPVINLEKCNKCWICFVYCPEGVISLDESEYPHIDYDHCKGCLICYEECPVKVITVEREIETW